MAIAAAPMSSLVLVVFILASWIRPQRPALLATRVDHNL
jgi:hypothetical protein